MGKDRQMRGYSVKIIIVLTGSRVEWSERRTRAEIDYSVFEEIDAGAKSAALDWSQIGRGGRGLGSW